MFSLSNSTYAIDISQKRPASPTGLSITKRAKCESSERNEDETQGADMASQPVPYKCESSERIEDETQAADMASQPVPYKPDEEERDGYYYGLAGNPRLVARTSSDRWSKPLHRRATWNPIYSTMVQTPKRYAAIEYEMASKWTKDLSLAIIEALDGCVWSYFFPIQIGLEDTKDRMENGGPRPKLSTILLIAVEKNCLKWEDAIVTALQCREILHSYLILDIEVEIREGRYRHHAASLELEEQIKPEAWRERTNQAILPMLSSLGYPIGYLEDRTGQGTVGLHLKLEKTRSVVREDDKDNNSVVYGLTCRHVVRNNRAPDVSYASPPEGRQYHVQADQTGFEKCLDGMESIQMKLQAEITRLETKQQRWDDWYSHDETLTHKDLTAMELNNLKQQKRQATYNADLTKLLRGINEKPQRIIGHLAFHPNCEISSVCSGYLKDWALVELDPGKFKNAENKVFLGCTQSVMDQSSLDNGFLRLRLPDECDVSFLHEDEVRDGCAYDVGKRGSATGLTFGIKSGIEAVVRHPTPDGKSFQTWEMLIVPENGRFSAPGDSGASVFNLSGEVVGLVVGSSDCRPDLQWRGIPKEGSSNLVVKRYPGDNVKPSEADETPNPSAWSEGVDITFASPIQWVLEDIKDFTGLQARLA